MDGENAKNKASARSLRIETTDRCTVSSALPAAPKILLTRNGVQMNSQRHVPCLGYLLYVASAERLAEYRRIVHESMRTTLQSFGERIPRYSW